MIIQEKLELHNLKTRIALLQLRHIGESDVEKIKCPFCQSKTVYRQRQPETGNTHGCQSCEQKFSEESLPGCICRTPGRLQKCLDCARYQAILPMVKEKVSSLQNLSRQELESLLAQLEGNDKDTQGLSSRTNDDFFRSLVGLSALSQNYRPYNLFSQFSHQVVYISNVQKCKEAIGAGFPVSHPLDAEPETDSSDSF
jgi:transposase-like protein